VKLRIIWSWYTGHWWVGCYIWYSEEGTKQSINYCSISARFHTLHMNNFSPSHKLWARQNCGLQCCSTRSLSLGERGAHIILSFSSEHCLRVCGFRSTPTAASVASTSPTDCTPRRNCQQSSSSTCRYRPRNNTTHLSVFVNLVSVVVCLSVFPSVCLSVCLYVFLSVRVSVLICVACCLPRAVPYWQFCQQNISRYEPTKKLTKFAHGQGHI